MRGVGEIEVTRPLKDITFYGVYGVIEPIENNELFNFYLFACKPILAQTHNHPILFANLRIFCTNIENKDFLYSVLLFLFLH